MAWYKLHHAAKAGRSYQPGRSAGARRKRQKNIGLRRILGYGYWMANEPLACHWCGIEVQHLDELTVDHVVPRWQNGAHSPSNCVLACANCNNLRDQWDRWEAGLNNRPPKEPWTSEGYDAG